MFSNKQQEGYYASSTTMEFPWLSQFESLSPTLFSCFAESIESKIDLHNHSTSVSDTIGTNSNSNNGLEDEQEDGSETVLEKKLRHNAGERDRRRKLNALYSSLHALLPPDPKGKLSIPKTVDRVVKYIQEQKQELKRLSHKKDHLLKKMNSIDSSSQQITTNWLTDTEIAVQITTSTRTSISDMLLRLEEHEINVITVSSSVSSPTRIFYTLHLQMKEDCRVRPEELNGLLLGLRESS